MTRDAHKLCPFVVWLAWGGYALLVCVKADTSTARGATHPPYSLLTPLQQPPTESSQKITTIEQGKLVESEIPGGKCSYELALEHGQYSALTVDCHGKGNLIKLHDPGGAEIDRYRLMEVSPSRTIEVVAEISGRFGLEIHSPSKKAPANTCRIQNGVPRPASEKDHLLQRARTLESSAGAF